MAMPVSTGENPYRPSAMSEPEAWKRQTTASEIAEATAAHRQLQRSQMKSATRKKMPVPQSLMRKT